MSVTRNKKRKHDSSDNETTETTETTQTTKRRKKNNIPESPVASDDDASVDSLQSPTVHIDSFKAPPSVLGPTTPLTIHVPEDLSSKHIDFLSINEHMRFLDNSNKVGHAVIIKNEKGEEVALQYQIPEGTEKGTPAFRRLTNIQSIERYGMHRYKATTPTHNTTMYASRFIEGEFGSTKAERDEKPEKIKIALFSPTAKSYKGGEEPFWGGKEKETPLFRSTLSDSAKKELAEELKEIKPSFKGGDTLIVDHQSVFERDLIKTRKPDQNTVMGESAKDAYEVFLESMTQELSPEMKEILKRAVDAPLRNAFKSNYRPEWLHAEGFSLTPMSKDPQVKENLGAAGKWVNTEMMVLERIVKWFALHRPQSYLTIKPYFEMLLDTDIIKKVNFEVYIEERARFVRLLQEIDPFKKWPLFRKATDIAQGTAITYSMLHGIPPLSKDVITNTNISLTSSSHHSTFTTLSSSNTSTTTTLLATKPAISLAKSSDDKATAILSSHMSSMKKTTSRQRQQPNDFTNHEKSTIQIFTTSQTANFDEPYSGTDISYCRGSGVVVAHAGKKYILTNAHVVENSVQVRARRANDHTKKYPARRVCTSYQCDLALLEVEDPEFLSHIEPVELGGMVSRGDDLFIAGFPIGGMEFCVSEGRVRRVETDVYAMSGLEMLQVQVSAAVNAGNSGGPVFSDDKLVGIAFQGYNEQGMGYMIPAPIISHFLTEAFSGRPYRGFPILPIYTQTLENPTLRQAYHLTSAQSGVLVSSIDTLCDAYSKLKPNDIILEIDGLRISNEGTVDVPGVGKCIHFFHVTHMKFIGDTVTLKILRKNADEKAARMMDVTITLDRVPLETEMVGQTVHDAMPTYLIKSGICLTTLTRNYLDGRGADLESIFFLDKACSLPDLPKQAPDDEFVVINRILDCEETEGYDDYENCLVKEINGVPINNIKAALKAFEENKEPIHKILTGSKRMLVVKNMSPAENKALLEKYNIPSDRSRDLMPSHDQPMPLHQPDEKHTAHKKHTSSATTSRSIQKPVSTEAKKKQNKSKHSDELTLADLPGAKRYRDTLNRLEEKYRNADDDDIDLNELTENDESDADYAPEAKSENSDNEAKSDSEVRSPSPQQDDDDAPAAEAKPSKPSTGRRLIKLSDKMRLFHQQAKKDDREDDTSPAYKRSNH